MTFFLQNAAKSCEESEYANFDYEALFYEGRFTSDKTLIEEAAGDVCYLSTHYIFGYKDTIAEDMRTECKQSEYVDYVYDAIVTHKFMPEHPMVSEIVGDICYWTCTGDRKTCRAWEKRCQVSTSKYIDLVLKLAQGQNGITTAVAGDLARDTCHVYHYFFEGKSLEESYKLGMECKNSPMVTRVQDLIMRNFITNK